VTRAVADILGRLVSSTSGAGRRPLMLTAAALAVAGFAGTGVWMLDSRAEAAAEVVIAQKARQQRQMHALNTMNEGTGAALVLEGDDAKARNARIPMSSGPIERLSAVTGLPTSGPKYETALKCMTQAVYYEAANEPLRGKRAVAQVVLNRMRHAAYPHSVCGVVYEGANQRVCQFSFTCDGSLLRKPIQPQWGEARAVAVAALAGATEPSVGTATHYHADYVVPRWAFKLGKLEQIGAHIFYRFSGYWGSSNAFRAHWSGYEAIPALDFDRLRLELAASEEEPVIEYVPGLTVVPDVKDRHAAQDVGGRIDMTKTWRLEIPDPVNVTSRYRTALDSQGLSGSESGNNSRPE